MSIKLEDHSKTLIPFNIKLPFVSSVLSNLLRCEHFKFTSKCWYCFITVPLGYVGIALNNLKHIYNEEKKQIKEKTNWKMKNDLKVHQQSKKEHLHKNTDSWQIHMQPTHEIPFVCKVVLEKRILDNVNVKPIQFSFQNQTGKMQRNTTKNECKCIESGEQVLFVPIHQLWFYFY